MFRFRFGNIFLSFLKDGLKSNRGFYCPGSGIHITDMKEKEFRPLNILLSNVFILGTYLVRYTFFVSEYFPGRSLKDVNL